jgi:hypothetical protein
MKASPQRDQDDESRLDKSTCPSHETVRKEEEDNNVQPKEKQSKCIES